MSALSPDQRFEVGEIAILQNCIDPVDNGKEAIINSLPLPVRWRRTSGKWVDAGHYSIVVDGEYFQCEPHKLRKKRPPREDLKVVRWDHCPWQPEKVHV